MASRATSATIARKRDATLSFSVPIAALAGIETHQIKLSSKDQSTLTVQQVEMSLHE